MQGTFEIFKDLIQTDSLLVLEILKNSSENEKLVIFRDFFSSYFRPPTLNLTKIPVNQPIKKIWTIRYEYMNKARKL